MGHAEFIVAFHGRAADGGRIDVRDLAPALLSLGRAIDASNLVLNGEGQPVRVEVRALSEGSFEVQLDVVLTAWDQLKTFLHTTDVDSAKQLIEWLGLIGGPVGASLIVLYRFLRGRSPERVERSVAGHVRLHLNGETLTVPVEVLRLYQDVAVNRALGQLLDTLQNEALDRIEFRKPGSKEPAQVLTRDDRSSFSIPSPRDQTVVDETRTLALSIRSLAFQEGNKWRLFDGQNVITATIEDEDFIFKVDRSAIRFAKGDILICDVRTIQHQTSEGLRTEHHVIRMKEHRPAQTQISLPFDD